MTEEEIIARGKEMFDRCYGGVIPAPRTIDAKGYSGMSMKMFNDFWGDERLTFREKRLVVMGVIAGQGADPSAFLTGNLNRRTGNGDRWFAGSASSASAENRRDIVPENAACEDRQLVCLCADL